MLPDILAPGLAVVFCGLNPGLQAAETGHHFAGHSNRFWRVLHLAGFTPRELDPGRDREILSFRCGLTTVVARPTRGADALAQREFVAGAEGLLGKVERFQPRHIAFLGKAGYLAISGLRDLGWGPQLGMFGGAAVWVLPNPSGRNRAFTLGALVEAYRPLCEAIR
jgi:TDG/mug DNA glycosylase family protein